MWTGLDKWFNPAIPDGGVILRQGLEMGGGGGGKEGVVKHQLLSAGI